MAEDIGSLVVRIEANLNNFNDGLNTVSNKLDGFGGTVKKLGGIIAGAFVVKEIGAFFKSTIEDAAEAEDNLKQLNTVIASTGGKAGVSADQVTELAASLQKTTKFSDDAIIAGDNLLLTFTNINKDVFPAATETMLNMSQALGQDVKGSAIQLGKALNDPIKGITALSRVGVSFTDAQREQIKVLQESGNIMGAQKVILKELETEFGGAAKAAGETFSGKLERLNNQFGEIKESIGGALLPVLSSMAGWFIEKIPAIQNAVMPFFNGLADTIKYFAGVVQGDAYGALDNLQDMIYGTFGQETGNKIFDFLFALTDSFYALSDTIKNEIVPIFTNAFNYIVTNVLPPIIEIIKYLAIEIVPLLAKKIQEWLPIIIDIWEGLWDIIKVVIDNIVKAFQFAWPYIKDTVTNSVNLISGVISGLLKMLRGVIDFVAGVFTGDWRKAWEGIKSIFSGIWDSLGAIVKGALNGVIAMVNTGIKALNNLKIDVPDWLTEKTGIKDFGFNIPQIPKLATGTNFVPFDTMAFIHKGEAVVPANNNPSNPTANNPIGNNSFNFAGLFDGAIFNVRSDNDAKMIAREIYNLQQSRSRGNGIIAAT